MNKVFAALLAVVVLIVVAAGIVAAVWVSYSNTEIRLRAQVEAQQQSNEAVFDNTWKIIAQQAGVSSQYKDAFKEIYPALMNGRYGNARGGAMMSWITEHNPNFDARLYEKVMNSIEAQRTIFTTEQKKLVDLSREQKTLLATFPGSFFLSGRTPTAITIVTSSKTEASFKSGKDDDVDLFKHDSTPAPSTTSAAASR